MKINSNHIQKNSLFLVLLLFVLGFSASTTLAADAQWQASYWNNRTLSGSPVITRGESNLNYDWGDGQPDQNLPKDNFSARWTRSVYFTAGTYRFTATMDDGMRVWVDNALIIDSWWDSQVHSMSGDINLSTGDHVIRVDYYDAGGKAVAKLNWTPIGNTAPPPIYNWRGEYFNNPNLAGSPVLVRDDSRIDFNWGTGSPDGSVVPADGFSARWTRSLHLDGGQYRVTARGDDGIRVWVNGQLLINQWHEAQGQYYTADINIPTGSTSFQMEFYENLGGAQAFLDFYRVGGGGGGGTFYNWRGEYFNNRNLSGSPALTRDDTQINFNWGNNSPAGGINADNFSVRWTRTVSFAPGRYRFSATSDDGIRVWVNGQQVINNWVEQAPQTASGEVSLSGGNYPIQVEYFDSVGGAQVLVSWTQVTSNPTPAPSNPTAATGTVVSPMLNVRRGPGFEFGVITQLSRGTAVNLLGYRTADNHWVMINYNGAQAWVSGKPAYLSTNVPVSNLAVWQGSTPTPGTPTTGQTAVVKNAYYVNLRRTPQVGNNVIQAVPAGTTVQLLGRNSASTWAKVRLPNQAVGWMNGRYLSGSVAISTLPVSN